MGRKISDEYLKSLIGNVILKELSVEEREEFYILISGNNTSVIDEFIEEKIPDLYEKVLLVLKQDDKEITL